MIITFIVYTIWGICDFLTQKAFFDEFDILGIPKKHTYRCVWAVYYFTVTYLYWFSKYQGYRVVFNCTYFAYYLRIVPFIWSAFGFNLKVPAISFFYEQVEAVLASSLAIVSILVLNSKASPGFLDDFFASVVSLFFLIFIKVLSRLNRRKVLESCMADLSFWDYLLMIVVIYMVGSFETDVCLGYHSIMHTRAVSVLAMILVILVCGRLIIINEQKLSHSKVIKLLDDQMQRQLSFYRQVSEKDDELREYRHDTINHLIVIDSMITDERLSEASDYIHSLMMGLKSTKRTFYTGSYIADAILSTKTSEAAKEGIRIEFAGRIPCEKIKDLDMVIIFSNLIDNAVEACEKVCSDRIITVDSVNKDDFWILTIRNPLSEPVQIKDNHIKTTKSDKKLHGIGIMDVEKVVARYDGMVRFFSENNEFTVRVTVKM